MDERTTALFLKACRNQYSEGRGAETVKRKIKRRTMAYYMRVLSRINRKITPAQLEERVRAENLYAQFKIAGTAFEEWEQLVILDAGDREIAFLERQPVSKGSFGKKRIERYLMEIMGCRPASAVRWLTKYLKKVKVIYSFQLMDGVDEDDGRQIVTELMREIFETSRGIMQEDGVGFTNTEGFNILLTLPPDLTGKWPVAVYRWGLWTAFEMDLGDHEQVADFHKGKVPGGVNLL